MNTEYQINKWEDELLGCFSVTDNPMLILRSILTYIDEKEYYRLLEIMKRGNKMFKITYDREADAAYIYFPAGCCKHKETIQLDKHYNFDYDDQGHIIGIEILFASEVLSEETIADAEDITRSGYDG